MSRLLRLAPHIHTDGSDDSSWSLSRLVATLRRAGFDGALVCDHDRTMDDDAWLRLQSECHRVGDASGFLLVPGIEYQDAEHVVHLPVFGAAPFYGRSPDIGEVIARARSDGAAPVLAHPARRDAWRRVDPSWARDLAAIEVWNRKYDGLRPHTWALAWAREHRVAMTVALDWHGPRQLFPLALRVPDPTAQNNEERTHHVVRILNAGGGSATAFGVDVRRYDGGIVGAGSRRAEQARRWAAPKIRRVEQVLRGRA